MKTFKLFKEDNLFGIQDENGMAVVYNLHPIKDGAIEELIYFLRLNNTERFPFLSYKLTEGEIINIENQLKNQQIA